MSNPKPLSKIPSSTWLLLISACLLVMLSFGYRSGFGLFVKPISEANSWGRDVIGFSMAIQNLVWGVVAVFAGGLADRFGNVRVIISGAAIYALGMGLMPHVTAPWMLHSTAGMMVGAGVAGTSFGIVLPALARAVSEDRRQWVLGVGTAAGSMGQFLVVPISQGLIDQVGWISALHILPLICLHICQTWALMPKSGLGVWQLLACLMCLVLICQGLFPAGANAALY